MRYSSIDASRFFLACMIVGIHNPYGMPIVLAVLFKIAVPLFFMISGFFSVYSEREKALQKSRGAAFRILKMAVLANILYLVWGMWMNRFHEMDYLRSIFSPSSIVRFIFFNDTPVKIHLWFLSALVMCYAMTYLIVKWNIGKRIYIIIIPLLIALAILEWDNIILSKDIYNAYYRNFWFIGSAYFLIGRLIRENAERIRAIQLNNIICVIVSVISYAIAVLQSGITGLNDVYTILLIPELIIIIKLIQNNNVLSGSIFEKWGKKYSLPIYIFHPIVCDLISINVYIYDVDRVVAMYAIVPVTIVILLAIFIGIDKIKNGINKKYA